MKTSRLRPTVRILAAACALTLPLLAACSGGESTADGDSDGKLAPLADGFPSRSITLWNTFEPGHTDDLLNKAFAEVARKYSPVPIITDSRPAPGPVSWYGHVEFLSGRANAKDGYDLYAVSWAGATVRPWTVQQLADAKLETLKPVGVVEQAPFVFAVPKESPYDTLADVEQAAKADPGKLRAVAGQTGSLIHSTLAVWQAANGIAKNAIRFIPTGGSGEALTVIRGGGADLAVVTYSAGIEDQMKVLAVSGEAPFAGLPDVPVAQAGGKPIPVGSERGFGALPDAPQEHLDWFYELMQKVAADPTFQERQHGFDFNVRDGAWVQGYRQQIVDTVIPVLEENGLTTGLRK
ncbi:tripartite tricarboxylate transporter substrate binding protein [Plantactinospora sp. KBS50]|uniref:Bug family tripartite tricarboxylate transporter substrate binding protein n=1 Tax=Plantactinospora sp. KBS50 TaxID=2024580 RepID=UPI0012FD518C|nr:tripartite tricarboxylate transporter substrate-binding protein [Plantactinospora sp. KBS50]